MGLGWCCCSFLPARLSQTSCLDLSFALGSKIRKRMRETRENVKKSIHKTLYFTAREAGQRLYLNVICWVSTLSALYLNHGSVFCCCCFHSEELATEKRKQNNPHNPTERKCWSHFITQFPNIPVCVYIH